MSLVDLRKSENDLAYQLFRLQNERDSNEKNNILLKIQNVFVKYSEDEIFSMLKQFLNLKHDNVERDIKGLISNSKILNSSLAVGDFESMLKLLNEQKNSPFKKNVEYTKYLIVCDEYESKTGKKPTQDKVQSIDTQDNTSVHPIETAPADVHNQAPVEAHKPPVFVDKKDYKNGSVRIYHGIKLDDFLKIEQDVANELNSKNPGSIKFEKTELGCIVSGISGQVFAEFQRLRDERLQQKYAMFSHDSEKKEKEIPEKYHISSKDVQKNYTNKLGR